MLKIKADIDLKELEKFGFVFNRVGNRWKQNLFVFAVFSKNYKKTMHIKIGKDITVYNSKGLDILFDLIQAGLVEKVEEKSNEN